MKKKLIATVLLTTMVFSTQSIAYASIENSPEFKSDNISIEATTDINIAKCIDAYQDYFQQQGTSVREIMTKEIEAIYAEISVEQDAEKKERLYDLIREYENVIVEYETYQASQAQGNNEINTLNSEYTDAALIAGVDAVISYFTLNDYPLAAELMTYSKKSGGRTYYPVRTDNVRRTSEYARVRGLCVQAGSNSISGSAEFNQGTKAENDLYYAIHGCSYTYSNHTLTFKDLYDFELAGSYESLANIAVNMLYVAQQRGIVQPYYLFISMAV